MSASEIIFPTFKKDKKTQVEIKNTIPSIIKFFSSVDGLEHAYKGIIMDENHASITNDPGIGIFVLEWENIKAFHDFYPQSDQYRDFSTLVGPLLAAKPVPRLYEPIDGTLTACLNAPITQIFVLQASASLNRWRDLVSSIKKQAHSRPSFYHAMGIEQDVGTFISMIGWSSVQEYELFGREANIQEFKKEIGHASTSIVVRFEPLKV
ncbi:uncharacterized protein PV09_06129 [Verruconis gallopava]|uniref:ABM domain-containing protein n=1 Tax=Verruconis gallopava TaxID=253628 RepID=A0A0D1YPZ8_9PEZI|nr:uncharacterized protein PV09_06129 [Verruconis gallopava]KIW02692.1 hypothetical protein PV09_06129 [Verruconis gallopava]